MKTPFRRRFVRAIHVPFGLLVLLVLLIPSSAIEAQVLYGSIVGNVKDASSAVLPGATVVITHDETKATRETTTDATGAYRFPTVQTGTYTFVVKMTGFRAFTRNGVEVTLNSVARVDAALSVGGLEESVTVSGEKPLLQTDRAEMREELRARELQDLPVPVGRNYQELFSTLPGFTPPADAHSIPSNPSRALTFNVNGASNQGNNTRIDGVSSTNIWLPHVVAYVPALESIETVNVVTNNFDAEQGLAGGAAISVQIKSGTNQLRGSAFEYHFNEKMRAKNYFTPPGTNEGKWLENQFGGTLGGPFRQNKLFYFVSYEGTRQDRQVPRTISVPTAAIRTGDFSQTGVIIHDPFTGSPDGTGRIPFANSIIPANRISGVATKLLAFLPMPNLSGETDNYFVQPRFTFNRWTVDSKVNWNATDRLQVFGRYSQLDFDQNSETVFGPQLQGDDATGGGNPGHGWGNTFNLSTGATYTLGNNVVIDGNFGWVRMTSNVEMSDVRENKGREWLGIPGTNGPNLWEGGLPFFDLDGYTDFGTIEAFMPYYRDDDQYQMVANVSWLKGRHNIRLGSDMLLHGHEPHPAGDQRRQLRSQGRVRIRRRSHAPSRRSRRQQFQQLCGLPPRAAERGRTPQAERRALHHTQLAVQYLPSRSVAGEPQSHAVLRHAVRVLPDPDARRGSRSRAVQPRDEQDGDRRSRRSVDRPRHLDAEEPVRAPPRGDLPPHRFRGSARRHRVDERSVIAGPLDAHEPSDPIESLRRGPARVDLRAPHRGGDPGDSRRRSGGRDHPGAGERHRGDAADGFQARPGVVVEHGIREGAAVAAGRRARLHRHAPDRSTGAARTELGTDRRRQQRPAVGPEIRPHGSHGSHRADWRYELPRDADAHQPAVQQRLFVQRQLHAVAIRGTCRGVEQRPAATGADSGSVRSESRGL